MAKPRFYSGLVVTTLPCHPRAYRRKYRGVWWGEAWAYDPSIVRDKSIDRVEEYLRKMTHNGLPEFIADEDLAREYYELGPRLLLPMRLLLCSIELCLCSDLETLFLHPDRATQLRDHGQWLGWDTITCSCDYSSTKDDFFGRTPSPLRPFRKALNRFGLFDDAKTAREYLRARQEYIMDARRAAGVPLDGSVPLPSLPLEDFVVLSVVEVIELASMREEWF